MIGKTLKWNLDDLIVPTAVTGGVFLLLETVVAIVLFTVRPETTGAMGGLILPIVAGFVVLISNITHPVITFDLMLRCSVSRKNALGSVLATMAMETVYALGLGYLLGRLDALIANIWVKALPWVTGVELKEAVIPLWGLGLAAVVMVLLGLGAGAALQRFGRKAFWILWVLWMLVFVFQSGPGWEKLFGVPWLIPAVAVISLAAGAWGSWSLLHTSVRQ